MINAKTILGRAARFPIGVPWPGLPALVSRAALLLLPSLTVGSLLGATVVGHLEDPAATNQNVTIRFTMVPEGTSLADGNTTVLGFPVSTRATNGNFSASLKGGWYRTQIGALSKPVLIVMPPNDTNTYQFNFLANLATNLGSFGWTNFLGRISERVLAGTNVTIGTNNAGLANESVTINGSAGGSSLAFDPQLGSANLTNWSSVSTGAVAYATQLGTAAYSNSASFASATVTNPLQSSAWHAASDFQSASQALSDFASLGTNWAYPRSNPSNFVSGTVTNPLQSAAYQPSSAFQAAGSYESPLTFNFPLQRSGNAVSSPALTNNDSRNVVLPNGVTTTGLVASIMRLYDTILGGAPSSYLYQAADNVVARSTDGSFLTSLSAGNIGSGTLNASRLPDLSGTYEAHAATLTNKVLSTNVTLTISTLSPTSQTNYTIPLLPGPGGDMVTIWTANTNCFLTFTGTNNANWQRTVLFIGFTSTVSSAVSFAQALRTNLNLLTTVTNGTSKAINFYNPDGNGTNLMASDAGTYR